MNADTRQDAAPQLAAGSENCLPVGTWLSDFEITGVLGEGGFGIVYVAYDHALQRTVAIKEYMPGALAMRAAGTDIALRAERHRETFRLGLKSFINEARLLAQFDHPALVKVYRFWEQNNTAYTAMKFYAGRTIKEIVADNPNRVGETWCRQVLDPILQALGMLHRMQILHRDISPDNIIVQDNGDAVLLDFGSARQIIGDMARGLTVIVKPGYAPVEQYAGDASHEQGPFTDLYALSGVMVFAITKTPPPASIGRIINDPVVPLAVQAPPGYGAPLLAAIDQGFAVLAQDRPQTVEAFRKLLGLAPLDAAPAHASPAPPRTVPPRAAPPVPPPGPPPGPPAKPPAAATATPAVAPGPKPAPRRPAPAAPVAPAPRRPGAPSPDRRRWLLGGAAVLVAIAVSALYTRGRADGPALASRMQLPASASPAVAASAASDASADGTPAPSGDETASAAAASSTTYKIRIQPWGTLYVDGESRGVSPPLKQIELTHGKHDVRIVNPNFPTYVATIEVDGNAPAAIEHDFNAARPPTPN